LRRGYCYKTSVIRRKCGQTLGLGLVDRNRTVVKLLVYNGREIGDRHVTWKSYDRV